LIAFTYDTGNGWDGWDGKQDDGMGWMIPYTGLFLRFPLFWRDARAGWPSFSIARKNLMDKLEGVGWEASALSDFLAEISTYNMWDGVAKVILQTSSLTLNSRLIL